MRDIRYKWNEGPNSVGVSSEVSLPQFKVITTSNPLPNLFTKRNGIK